ncbi:hypothetical protein BRAO375_3660080 [Bradyrhizobium sp. ORS 375]|uniref:hypothetical protein n=1 Tax=Bradyrhizobium sp. (strain ORS 375) TaxID=566679 RepID=UPI00024069B0|nr:hypothetical protein [Bradyrhizobium sp. ORS 375]CCD94686.1 hypothetical protein BRAO375_3660080 [Bradyrhizobium sp. ORS 375]
MTFPFASICPGNSKPAPFAFANVANAIKGQLYASNTITPTGYDSPALVSASGCEYSINGGAWTTLSTFIYPGQNIAIRAYASSSWQTSVTAGLSIDTTATTWTITTAAVTAGAWDSGWTTGSWNVSTPSVFNWFRVQMWAPGGGGGGGGGGAYGTLGSPGGSGGSGGVAQFAGGPYAAGGGGGGGGGGASGSFAYGSVYDGSPGAAGGHGNGYGGDTNTFAGGAGGGAGGGGGSGTAMGGGGGPGSAPRNGGAGGTGGTGGYILKTYAWGQIAAATAYSVVIQGPGGGGAPGGNGGWGNVGAYGRCYIDWG